ncbi:MAG TPA: hypothetical protein VE090_05810 [Methylomirabilota bacterium]|nr:hypothetical protein [Methylomirabilota bacterium]
MAKTLLEKMFYKSDYSLAIVHSPQDLQSELNTETQADDALKGTYHFILAFYTKKGELEKEVKRLKEALRDNGLLWIAYPKGKALQTDLNRDILHKLLEQYQLTGVSLVSFNDTWSAMRFKKE